MTQEDLSERLGSTKSTISRLETGHERASLQRLIEIADALDADVRDFFATLVEDRDPREVDSAGIGAMLRRASPEETRRAVEVVRALLKR